MRNKMFFIVIAVVSLVPILWWSSSSTKDLSLAAEKDPALPILANAKSTITPNVLYSPAIETKPKPADTIDLKQPELETQPESRDEIAIESMHEARLEGYDRTSPMTYDAVSEQTFPPEELTDPERYNEYETPEEMKLQNTYLEAGYPEMQNIAQQLQAMRDTGADEADIHEAEAKLTQSQQMTQRLQDQQSISKTENINAENASEAFP